MLKLLWFSPLPPAQTDIANYSARIASALSNLVDVTFVRPDSVPADHAIPSVPIGSLSPRRINQADLCIYQMGNNRDFHSEIFEVARRHPGLVVLHDRAIHEFLLLHLAEAHYQTGIPQRQAYRQALARWYGPRGLAAALAVEQGTCGPQDLAADYPLFEAVLDSASGVVCHNPLLTAELKSRFPKLPMLTLPLPFAAPATCPERPFFQPGERIRLVMFGYMASNRRAAEFLEVWSRSGRRDRFELHIAGRMSDRARFDQVAKVSGLGPQIVHHDFLAEGALDALIASADMALNLRNPSMGEASGSQLRIWANGCPSAVSDSGWYATLPRACAHRISIDREADDLALLLEDLATSRLDLARLRQRGFAQLQQHDPSRYARNLVSWIGDSYSGMALAWAEMAIIGTVATSYAEVLPLDACPSLPKGLLDPIGAGLPV